MNKYLPIILALLLHFVACKRESRHHYDTTGDDFFSDLEIRAKKNLLDSSEIELVRDIIQDRSEARDELLELLDSYPVLPSFMIGSFYHVDHIIMGEKPMDVTENGIWYYFNENFTYEQGDIEGNFSKGRYAYKEHKNTILLFPDDYHTFPEEWKILHSDDMLVFAGTSKFGNNNVQKRMIRVKKRPGLID